MLTCNLEGTVRPQQRTDAGNLGQRDKCSPRSGVISDLDGQIENILPKRVARKSSKVELRREPISILSERIRIEGVAYMQRRKFSCALGGKEGK